MEQAVANITSIPPLYGVPMKNISVVRGSSVLGAETYINISFMLTETIISSTDFIFKVPTNTTFAPVFNPISCSVYKRNVWT